MWIKVVPKGVSQLLFSFVASEVLGEGSHYLREELGVGWCLLLLLWLLVASSDMALKHAWVLLCNTSYCHFKNGLRVFVRSGHTVSPVSAIRRADLISPGLLSAWHLRGEPGEILPLLLCPSILFTCPGFGPLSSWSTWSSSAEAEGGRGMRGIPDLHLCFHASDPG